MEIRKATMQDSVTVSNLFSLLYKPKKKWSEESIKKQILDNEKSFYILLKNGEIIGAIGAKFIKDECKVGPLVIKKAFRKTGGGTLLMNYVERLCKEKKIKRIFGHSLVLYNAEKFYVGLGYKSNLIKQYWENHDCYFLEKEF